MRNRIVAKSALLRQAAMDWIRMLFSSKMVQGEGIITDCRLKKNAHFGIFSPQAMAFCEKNPDEDVIFLVAVAFKGKEYIIKKREFFCIGKKVKVTYCKSFYGIRIENIEQIRYFLYQ